MILGWTSAILGAFVAVVGASILIRFRQARLLRQELGVVARPKAALSYRVLAIPFLQPRLRPSLMPVRLEVSYVPFAFLTPALIVLASALRGKDLDSVDLGGVLLFTGLIGAGLAVTILLARSGKSTNLAVAAYSEGLAIYRPLNSALLAWRDVETIFVDPPQTGGYLQSDDPVSLHIYSEDGRTWRFGVEELAAGPDDISQFADFALAQAYAPAAMRPR